MSGDVAAVKEVSPGYGFSEASALASNDIKQNQSAEMSANRNTWNLGDLSDFVTSGSRGWAAYYAEYGSLFIRSQNIKAGRLDFQDSQHVIPPAGAEGNRTLVRRGDILITITGNSVGNVAFVDREIGEAYISQHVGLIRLKDPSKADYICRFLSPGSKGNHQIVAKQSGQSKPGLTLQDLKDLVVDIPVDQEEQRAIATALSDVDALLEELDRLIAKKRDLKQATMQQLLTGQTRLPGFEGEWESVRLGDHANFLRNGTNSRAELASDGSVKYLHYGDIHTCSSATLKPDKLPYLPDHMTKSLDKLQTGDLIFADASEDMGGVGKSVEIVDLDEGKVVSGLHTIAVRFSKAVLADGFKAYLQNCPSFINQLRRLAAGTKVYATTRRHIAGIELELPCVEEQREIASIFSAMDSEIEALEQRRTKTAAVKQAMMQELLTGRTRLI